MSPVNLSLSLTRTHALADGLSDLSTAFSLNDRARSRYGEDVMHIEINTVAQIITATGLSVAAVLTALSKFLPVWRQGRNGSADPPK